ncbi:MAG: hypothetical protein ACQEWG_14890 [Bacteroidota bacterium]
MKTIISYFSLLLMGLMLQTVDAQNDSISHVQKDSVITSMEYFQKERDKIITKEKESLKQTLEGINYQLEKGLITPEQAKQQRENAAKKHALNIENRIAILENELELKDRNKEHYKKVPYDRRTTGDIVLAFGLNNAISNENPIDDSDFKIGGSRFFEIGWAWKTRVLNNSNVFRLKYGVSFQFNGLKPTDNRYFVERDELTVLEEFPLDLDKSKFRMDNLVFPVHFEFGPSKRTETEKYFRYSTHGMFKIGLGGYAGFNIGERQKLKYREDGDKIKEKLNGDYNTNEFIYGLSGYLSLGGTALYVKYDLNPIFKDPNIELNNISVGLRFDID